MPVHQFWPQFPSQWRLVRGSLLRRRALGEPDTNYEFRKPMVRGSPLRRRLSVSPTQIMDLESPVLVHFDESAAHKNPSNPSNSSNPSALNGGGLSWKQECTSNDKYMCKPVSHNIGCYEGPFLHRLTWACVRWATWENIEVTWENKDKVTLLQKLLIPNVSWGHVTQSISLSSTLGTQDGKRVTRSASILMGEVLTQELYCYFRAFLFLSGFPHTGSSILFMKRLKVVLFLFQPKLKMSLALAETIAQILMVTSCYVCGGTNMGDQWPWEAKELDH